MTTPVVFTFREYFDLVKKLAGDFENYHGYLKGPVGSEYPKPPKNANMAQNTDSDYARIIKGTYNPEVIKDKQVRTRTIAAVQRMHQLVVALYADAEKYPAIYAGIGFKMKDGKLAIKQRLLEDLFLDNVPEGGALSVETRGWEYKDDDEKQKYGPRKYVGKIPIELIEVAYWFGVDGDITSEPKLYALDDTIAREKLAATQPKTATTESSTSKQPLLSEKLIVDTTPQTSVQEAGKSKVLSKKTTPQQPPTAVAVVEPLKPVTQPSSSTQQPPTSSSGTTMPKFELTLFGQSSQPMQLRPETAKLPAIKGPEDPNELWKGTLANETFIAKLFATHIKPLIEMTPLFIVPNETVPDFVGKYAKQHYKSRKSDDYMTIEAFLAFILAEYQSKAQWAALAAEYARLSEALASKIQQERTTARETMRDWRQRALDALGVKSQTATRDLKLQFKLLAEVIEAMAWATDNEAFTTGMSSKLRGLLDPTKTPLLEHISLGQYRRFNKQDLSGVVKWDTKSKDHTQAYASLMNKIIAGQDYSAELKAFELEIYPAKQTQATSIPPTVLPQILPVATTPVTHPSTVQLLKVFEQELQAKKPVTSPKTQEPPPPITQPPTIVKKEDVVMRDNPKTEEVVIIDDGEDGEEEEIEGPYIDYPPPQPGQLHSAIFYDLLGNSMFEREQPSALRQALLELKQNALERYFINRVVAFRGGFSVTPSEDLFAELDRLDAEYENRMGAFNSAYRLAIANPDIINPLIPAYQRVSIYSEDTEKALRQLADAKETYKQQILALADAYGSKRGVKREPDDREEPVRMVMPKIETNADGDVILEIDIGADINGKAYYLSPLLWLTYIYTGEMDTQKQTRILLTCLAATSESQLNLPSLAQGARMAILALYRDIRSDAPAFQNPKRWGKSGLCTPVFEAAVARSVPDLKALFKEKKNQTIGVDAEGKDMNMTPGQLFLSVLAARFDWAGNNTVLSRELLLPYVNAL